VVTDRVKHAKIGFKGFSVCLVLHRKIAFPVNKPDGPLEQLTSRFRGFLVEGKLIGLLDQSSNSCCEPGRQSGQVGPLQLVMRCELFAGHLVSIGMRGECEKQCCR
jgi:hypothetical protein